MVKYLVVTEWFGKQYAGDDFLDSLEDALKYRDLTIRGLKELAPND